MPLLEAGQIEQTAAMLARAFDIDAAYRYLFPGDERAAALSDLFRRNLSIHLPYRCTRVACEGDRVVATLTIRPPGGIDDGPLVLLRHGFLPFALARGPRAIRRLLWLKSTYGRLEDEAASGRPHWHLHMVAVEPQMQGRGIGTQLLSESLEAAIGPASEHPIVLTTHLEQNLAFYKGAGFLVCGERRLQPPDGQPFVVWSMRRP